MIKWASFKKWREFETLWALFLFLFLMRAIHNFRESNDLFELWLKNEYN